MGNEKRRRKKINNAAAINLQPLTPLVPADDVYYYNDVGSLNIGQMVFSYFFTITTTTHAHNFARRNIIIMCTIEKSVRGDGKNDEK
jgi:hypothetical protein